MSNSRTNKVFIIIAIIIVVFAITFGVIERGIISKKGIYVVAIIEEVSRNKSGSSVHVSYYYNENEFRTSFKPGYDFGLKIGRKFFVKILPNRPKQYDYYNIDVPECALDSNWRNGWKEIPNCDKE